MKRMLIPAAVVCCLFLSFCSSAPNLEPGLSQITEESLRHHIRAISDDSMMGRAPATRGEQMVVDYIIAEFEEIGIEPGMPDGSWVQHFPILAQQTDRNTSLRITRGNNTVHNFPFGTQLIVSPAQDQREISIRNAEMVYVGYGIVAPEEGWNDYKGLDVTGKILIMKNSDPANHPDKFDGEARTYYGRWTYKYEIAQELGALGVLIVHTTPTAGYPWSVVANSFGRERFMLKPEGEERAATQIQGWLSANASRALFESAGYDIEELFESAEFPDFRPIPLGNLRANIDVKATYRELSAQNVVGVLKGHDPILRDEYVVFSAHHDHLGVGFPVEGDSIYNGALDNASGVGAMLNMAAGFKAIQPQLKRSMLFVAVGAEESGLLGSKYFAANPTVPTGFMSANINLDGLNVFGPTTDLVSIGLGRTSIDAIMKRHAEALGRVIAPDPNPDQGYFYRSDHFSFAQQGVPATFTMMGTQFIGQPENYYREVIQPEMNRIYHTVFDEYNPDWDLSGAVNDTRLMFKVAFDIANAPEMMSWTPGNEFEAARERALQERRNMEQN
ncbi:MAG: M28 family peptidase [Bacteroidetes bacterium]|nr:M28 family peptidase [Bacteroidota bacterium]